jgi:hypothetical protein
LAKAANRVPGLIAPAPETEPLVNRALSVVAPVLAGVSRRLRLSSLCPLGLVVLAVSACALFTCQPVSVVVAEKEQRQRVDLVPVGFRTTETGRVEEVETARVTQTYWVRSEEGRWYSVPATDFEAAQVGRSLEVCR